MNRVVEIWLLYAATCSTGGWILSSVHALNPFGFICLHAVFLAAAIRSLRCDLPLLPRQLRKLPRRFLKRRLSAESFFSLRRLLPFSFLVLASLSLGSGLFHLPSNYDALTYRIPRVMHWLQHEGWHWIHTDNARMNTRGTGFEWLMAPQLSVWKSDRALFLINWVSYLFLPGLLFSFLRCSTAPGRRAWLWMWIWPWGLGYVLQASGTANDAMAAPYGLAAMVCGFNFYRQGSVRDFCFSILAAALLSGVKASNLPLLLPIAATLGGGLLRWQKTAVTLLVRSGPLLLFAALSSFLPTAWMNHRHCGDWTGTSLEEARFVKSPWIGLLGNGLQIIAQNFSPPILPEAKKFEDRWTQSIPPKLLTPLQANFEASFRLGLGEIPTEGSGLGLGLSLCLLCACLARPSSRRAPRIQAGLPRIILWLGPMALLWFLSKSALAGISRVILPYFPLALAPIMTQRGNGRSQPSVLFRILALFAFLCALGAVLVEPSRPLWPAQKILSTPFSDPWKEKARSRALQVYKNYGHRAQVYAPVQRLIPDGVTRIGFLNGTDDPVASLWKPYGVWQVEEFLPHESLQQLQKRRLTILLAGERGLRERCQLTIDQWINRMHGRPIGRVILQPSVQRGDEVWVLLAIPSGPDDVESR